MPPMRNQTLQRVLPCTAGAREQPIANEVSAAPAEDPKTQDLRAKVQALRVLLVRIAMRLTQSLSSSVVQQVNHRCAAWAGALSAVLRSSVHQHVHHRCPLHCTLQVAMTGYIHGLIARRCRAAPG